MPLSKSIMYYSYVINVRENSGFVFMLIDAHVVKNCLAHNSEICAKGVFYVGIDRILQTHRICTRRHNFWVAVSLTSIKEEQ
jgi:hypothetical protein